MEWRFEMDPISQKLYEYYDVKTEEEITTGYHQYQNREPDYDSFVKIDDGKIVPNYDRIREHIEKRFCPITYRGMVYIFDGTRYRIDDQDVAKEVHRCLMAVQYTNHHRMKGITDEIFKRIQTYSTVHELPFNQRSGEFIPCQNGLVEIETGNLLSFSPVYGFRYVIHADYDPTANEKVIEEFFHDLVVPKGMDPTEDNSHLMVQMVAQIITGQHHKTAYYLYNSTGNNGKSTLASLITAFVGMENTASLTLQEICDDKFAMAELEGKMVNLCPDLPMGFIPNTSQFKALTGGDLVNAQKKFGQPFQFVNKAIMVFGANGIPDVGDHSDAFFSRFIMVPFPNQFDVDPTFIERLTTETNMSGLLNLVIPEIRRIQKNGLMGKEDPRDIKDKWKKESNSAFAFIDEFLIPCSDGERIRFDDVFDQYIEYCRINGKKRRGEKSFESTLKNQNYRVKREGPAGEQIAYVLGCRKIGDSTRTKTAIQAVSAWG